MILQLNKKSHWFQVSASKLLQDESGNIKITNGFFEQNLKKKSKTVQQQISV